MRLMLSLPDRDVVVRCEPDDRTGEILALAAGRSVEGVALFAGSRPLDLRHSVAGNGLVDGAVIRAGRPSTSQLNPAPGTPVLSVIAGAYAGTVVPLTVGRTTVGRVPPLDLADPDVSREHVHLDVDAHGTVVATDAGSTNGATLDGRALAGPTPVPTGSVLWLGRTAVSVSWIAPPDAVTRPDGAGGLLYNRPPRLTPPRRVERIAVPTAPTAPDKRDWPVVMVLAPLAIGILMALVLRQPAFLLFVLLSPVMLLSSAVSDRRKGAKGHRAAVRAHAAAAATAQVELRRALAEETLARRRDAPDPAALLLAARGPSTLLWHRHRTDPDFLRLRLGVGDPVPDTEIRADGDTRSADTRLFSVPVTVDVVAAGAVGLAGPADAAVRSARWCVAQAALLHSPRDLQIVVLTDREGEKRWAWVRWLPHARGPVGGPWVRLGTDAETVHARLGELADLVDARRALVRHRGAPTVLDRVPAVLVVLDGAQELRSVPGVGPLLQDGPPLGVHVLAVDRTETMLPRECGAVGVIVPDDPTRVVVRARGTEGVEDGVVDGVSARWAETVARALAPLRDADPSAGEAALPLEARLTELVGLAPPRPEELLARWSRAPRSTVAVLGVSTEGPFRLDMADGPHALVAGTTGAGKSGLLQTLVSALAVANRPDAMTFLLIDYKGGAAFRDCARLPHCVGVVTDLDAGATSRALTSLRAELKRREHVLDRAGVADIGQYWSRVADPRRESEVDPLPRLVIVIDEFAQLVTEMPEFVDGLVDVAARGRSLGIHLVLATQQPQGVVNNQMRSNTTIRISLRVADETSSTDLVGVPDAARLPSIPGRAFVKVGAGVPVAIQTARTDTAPPGRGVPRRAPRATTLHWSTLGLPLAETADPPPPPGLRTDLSDLVNAVGEAARRARVAPQRSPWRPPLPGVLVADALASRSALALPFALEDLPEAQVQQAAVLDLRDGGHLAVVGAPRSGRSTVLRTLAAQAGRRTGTDEVHVYGVDCAGAALGPVAGLPHCGAIVPGTDPDRVDRLLTRLLREIARRQRLLAAAGAGDLAEYRDTAAGETLPFLLLLLDGYEAFSTGVGELDGGRVLSDLHRVLRDGPAVGLRAVLAGDRSLLVGQTGSLVSDRVVLRLSSETDYSYAGLDRRDVPDDLAPGRALRAGVGTQLQVALLVDDPSGRAQAAAFAGVVDGARARPSAGPAPFRIDTLPDEVGLAAARALPLERPGLLVGVGGDDLCGLVVDPAADGASVLVHGPRRSGRSTLLAVLAESAVAAGLQVVAWTPRASALRGRAGVVDLVGADPGEEALVAALGAGPCLLLVDDVEAVADTPTGQAVTRLLKAGEPHTVVVAGATDSVAGAMRGPALEAARSGLGVVLCPSQPIVGAVFTGAPRLPRSLVGGGSPGRGVLLRAGTLTPIQVPTP